MTRAQYYPAADRTTADMYRKYPKHFTADRFMSDVNVLVLHTTEGSSWPDYKAGSEAPTWTYDPRSHHLRQHIPVSMAARALVDLPGGVITDRLNVAQIEIIGYAKDGGPLDAQAIADLGALLAWLNREWSVPLTAPYAFTVPAHRMSFAEWNACRGVVGHCHVPENTHWDPGAMNVAAILAAATRIHASGDVVSAPVPKPATPTYPTIPIQEDHDMKDVIIAAFSRYGRGTATDGDISWWITESLHQGWSLAVMNAQIANSTEARTAEINRAFWAHLKHAPSAQQITEGLKAYPDWYQIDPAIAGSKEAADVAAAAKGK